MRKKKNERSSGLLWYIWSGVWGVLLLAIGIKIFWENPVLALVALGVGFFNAFNSFEYFVDLIKNKQ